ncbi:hypothetical protein [Bradyrhizobium sp. WSM1417]|uniref:hypothetical protein n=1 Tax=Bradyrhizobium sp. WSM1417 TaxID=754500 RepID=UPI0004874550|nr:hypothetical protein [Bradyrhizobium sp. WSM1417]
MTGPSPFKPYTPEADRWASRDDWKDDRSHEPEHVIAHFKKVYSMQGVAEYAIACDLKRRSELREVLTAAGWSTVNFTGSKYLGRLALIARAEGWHAKDNVKRNAVRGAAGHLNNVIARHRKAWSHQLPDSILDWLEQFFRLGWNDGKPDHRAAALADVMERTPQVDERGRRLRGDAASDYGSDRVALHRLRKLFAKPR